MKTIENISEIDSHYEDNGNIYIDVYHENIDQGSTIAIVCRATKKVFFIDTLYKLSQRVNKVIEDVLTELRKEEEDKKKDIEKIACKMFGVKPSLQDSEERYYNSHNVAKAEAFIQGYNYAIESQTVK